MQIEGLEGLSELGRGGFGVVYRAWQPELDREVAVKVLAISLDQRARQRFRREAAAMGRLSGHPHIIGIHHTGFTDGGEPYLVMPLLPGGSLGDRLRSSGPLSWVDVVATGIALSGALATAHHRGIVHRDIKPDNVLFDAFGQPVLGDFGIASAMGSSMTKTGEVTASLAYAPPEVIDGARPDIASDVYSLAATLYAALWGDAPFFNPDDTSMAPMLARILTKDPPDLTGRGVPADVGEVLLAAMTKDPAERLPDATTLGQHLQDLQAVHDQPRTALHILTVDEHLPDTDAAVEVDDDPAASDDADDPPATTDEPAPTTLRYGPAVSELGRASDVVRGPLVDAPQLDDPQRTATDKIEEVDRDWERTVIRRAAVAEVEPTPAPPERRSRGRWLLVAAVVVILGGAAAGAMMTLPSTPVDVVQTQQDRSPLLDDGTFADRIDDAEALTAAVVVEDERDREARTAGAWWALADWCTADERDTPAGCYDTAADYLNALAALDPRTLVLASDLDRRSVLDGVLQGYEAGLVALDLVADVDPGAVALGRPGNGLLCDPDCDAIATDIVQAKEDALDPDEVDALLAPVEESIAAANEGLGIEQERETPTARPAPPPQPPPPPPAEPEVEAYSPGCPVDPGIVPGFAGFSGAEQLVVAPIVQFASAHNAHVFEGRDTQPCALATLTDNYRRVHGIREAEWYADQSTSWFPEWRVDALRISGSTASVDVTFVSAQDPALGYQGQDCTQWSLSYRMVRSSSGRWLFDENTGRSGVAASNRC